MNKDFYTNDENCINRLAEEWKKYGKIIIAYDFDDTVFDFHKKGYTYDGVIEVLRKAKEIGAYFICFTGRSDVDFMKQYLQENNIPCDKINENMPFADFTGSKVYANIYLDDRGGLSASLKILEKAMDIISK